MLRNIMQCRILTATLRLCFYNTPAKLFKRRKRHLNSPRPPARGPRHPPVGIPQGSLSRWRRRLARLFEASRCHWHSVSNPDYSMCVIQSSERQFARGCLLLCLRATGAAPCDASFSSTTGLNCVCFMSELAMWEKAWATVLEVKRVSIRSPPSVRDPALKLPTLFYSFFLCDADTSRGRGSKSCAFVIAPACPG